MVQKSGGTGRRVVAWGAVLVAALALQLSPGPAQAQAQAQADDDPLTLPLGHDSTLPWYDAATVTFHLKSNAMDSPVGTWFTNFEAADRGGIVFGETQRLTYLRPNGRTSVVLNGNVTSWRVRTGADGGRQVAASVGRHGVRYLEIHRLDGSLVRRTPLAEHRTVFGFVGPRVWFGSTTTRGVDIHRFDIRTGRILRHVVRRSNRQEGNWFVDVDDNAIGISSDPLDRYPAIPLRLGRLEMGGPRLGLPPAPNAAWVGDPSSRIESVSPDRRFFITSGPVHSAAWGGAATLTVWNARTGKVISTLPGSYAHGYSPWEDEHTVILLSRRLREDGEPDYPETVDWVPVRTDVVTGAQERLADAIDRGKTLYFPSHR